MFDRVARAASPAHGLGAVADGCHRGEAVPCDWWARVARAPSAQADGVCFHEQQEHQAMGQGRPLGS